MSWSPQQDRALVAVNRWLKQGYPQVFRLFGFAGTGKTTLARTIAEGVRGTVLFGAYTGKAALVLKSKGCADARTIHSLIYKIDDENRGDPTFKINRQSDVRNASLVIIDECSMVDEALGRDLLSFGTPILVLGDPAQLPPVKGGGFFTEQRPDAMLTEIHRQASDNPIIHLAQEVREGRALTVGTYGESRVITDDMVQTGEVIGADQVLVGLNKTRKSFNRRFRDELKLAGKVDGHSEQFPISGDRLVCLRNNREKGLLNGSLWNVESWTAKPGSSSISMLVSNVDSYLDMKEIRVRNEFFTGQEADLPWPVRKQSDEFDYGYALTVHKAQGSQWDNVMLFDESRPVTRGDADASRRWLYTAITRAAEKVTVVL